MTQALDMERYGRLARPRIDDGAPPLGGRVGLNVPSQWWPTAPTLKMIEAAGFGWFQLHSPPRAMLCDSERSARHAAALRTVRDLSGLRLVLHAPDDLSAGTPEHDRAFAGLLDYAHAVGAELIVYHGRNFAVEPDGDKRVRDRVLAEERALRPLVARAEELGVTIAIENLAPVYPAPPRLCHTTALVAELVDRLRSDRVGMCFDVGHAHIVAESRGSDLRTLLEAVVDVVVLFHVHDNLGSRAGDVPSVPAVDPLRLDLHLPPAMGTVPWNDIAPLLVDHAAPLELEVHPPHRPDPATLAALTSEVLARACAREAA